MMQVEPPCPKFPPPSTHLHHSPSSPKRGSSALFNSVRVKPDKTKKMASPPPVDSASVSASVSISVSVSDTASGNSDPSRLLDDFRVPPRPATEPVPESGKSRLRLPSFLRKSRHGRFPGQDDAPVTDFDHIVNSGGTIHFSLTPTSVLESHERHRAVRQPTAVPARSPRSLSQSSRLTTAELQRQQQQQQEQQQQQQQPQLQSQPQLQLQPQHQHQQQREEERLRQDQYHVKPHKQQPRTHDQEEEDEDDESDRLQEEEEHDQWPGMTLAMHVGVQAGQDDLLLKMSAADTMLEIAVVDWLLCA